MNLFERWKNVIDNAKSLTAKDLEALRYLLIFLVIVDLFGVFWYLKLRSIGMALMIVLILGLALVLILERRIPSEPKEKSEDKGKDKPEPPQDSGIDFDMGLPSPEEYQRSIRKAVGF